MLSEEINREMIRLHNQGMLWKRVTLSGRAVKMLAREYSQDETQTHLIHWLLRGAQWTVDELWSGMYRIESAK